TPRYLRTFRRQYLLLACPFDTYSTSGLTGCFVRVGGQAHRADLTTSRIDDDSREPEMKKATQSAVFK
ncbi:hypothetical protein, partial [Klebsiella pneumoniae]|uniref:hypothetical protein n=1 Tax=Klebsiella pneumoniae TaxID=573 RepID=UPI0040554938